MWSSAPVRRNLDTLRADGRIVVHPAWGVEVAHRPEDRRPAVGPAPPPAAILEVIRTILAERPPALPRDPGEWDRLYASPEALPWWTETLDEDLAAVLAEAASTGAKRLLDLGAGAGTLAVEAARRGFEVVATDISAVALASGRRRAGELPIAWVLDDVTRTRLWGSFDVACDRGLLHCLDRAAWPAYAQAVARLIVPGGRLVLKVHAPDDAASLGTRPPTEDELAQLFAAAFVLSPAAPSRFPGPGQAPRALLYVLERRAAAPEFV
jgi:SAM-dependent methyltransferase